MTEAEAAINIIIAILGAVLVWTGSVISGMIWLNSKFRQHEKVVYHEVAKRDVKLYNHNTRIQRLEIKAFGFTGGNGSPTFPDDGETFPEES